MSTDTLSPQKSLKAKSATPAKVEVRKQPVEVVTQPPEIGRLQTISEDIRRGMIAEAAYYRSLKRNFSEGSEQEDWLLAEQEVDRRLASATRH